MCLKLHYAGPHMRGRDAYQVIYIQSIAGNRISFHFQSLLNEEVITHLSEPPPSQKGVIYRSAKLSTNESKVEVCDSAPEISILGPRSARAPLSNGKGLRGPT